MQCGRGVGCEAELHFAPRDKILAGVFVSCHWLGLSPCHKGAVLGGCCCRRMVLAIVEVNVAWLLGSCRGCCSFAAHCVESNGLDELRKLGHGTGG
jgi:hypothetical protein